MKGSTRPLISILFFAISNICQAQEAGTPKSLLWRISGNGLSKNSYLFGTMHLQDKRLFYFTDSLYSYLGSAEGFAMEIHPDSIMRASVAYVDKLHNQKMVKDKLSGPDYEKLKSKLKKDLNLEVDNLTVRDAYLLREKLTKPAPKADDMQTMVDLYLYGIAQDQGKILTGLEKVEDQLNLLDDFGNDFDVKKLMKDIDKDKEFTESMVQMYQQENLEDIQKITSFLPPEMEDKLLTRRNELMAGKMDSLMHEHSYFVAVGAAHLPGNEGLIELLRKKGYLVSPVFSNKRVDPSAYIRKNTDKWQEYSDSSQGFSVKMPGKPSPLNMSQGEVKLSMYLDLLTNRVYFVGFVRPGIIINQANADSLLRGMAEASARESNGKVISSRKNFIQGFYGLDAVIHNPQREMFMRVQYLAKGRRVYMVAMGSQREDDAKLPIVDEYLASFKIFEPKKSEWNSYKFSKDYFSIHFPVAPEITRIRENDSTVDAFKYVGADDNNGIAYMTTVTNVRPGYFFPSDSSIFSTYLKNLTASKGGILQEKRFTYEGFPADDFIADIGSHIYLKGRMINRGNRDYKILVFYEPESGDDSSIDRYINSFSFLPLNKTAWAQQSISELGMKVFAPEAFTKDKDEQQAYVKNANKGLASWHSNDSVYLSSPIISYQQLSPYTWAKNDTSLPKKYMNLLLKYNEKLEWYHFRKLGSIPFIEFLMKKVDGEMCIKGRIYLNGDKIITQQHTLPLLYLEDSEPLKFFEATQFEKELPSNLNMTNADKFFSDLHSTDSTRYTDAYEFLENGGLNIEPSDVDLLLTQAATKFPADSSHFQTVSELLIRESGKVANESNIELLKSKYISFDGALDKYRYDLLEILAKIQSDKSYNAIHSLLKFRVPSSGTAASFVRSLKNSEELSVKILPQLLKYSGDSILGNQLYSLYAHLLEKDFITIDSLKPFEAGMHKAVKYAQQKFQISKWNDYYLFPYHDVFNVLGKFQDKESYTLLQQFSALSQGYMSIVAIKVLLENNQTPSTLALDKLAADKFERTNLYDELDKAKKTSLFPQKYLNRKAFAESYLWNSFDDDEPASVEFVGTRTELYEGKKKIFYLFKINFDPEDPSYYLGISGPYDPNSTSSSLKIPVAGYFEEENYDPKRLDEFLRKFLNYYSADLDSAE
ncbi:MAG: hypothetical protein C5B52_02565 [Bacteroidetes bacterium]|nr:MAG: hypothetical protein C5B52_02565 [Bacteroidota bacterium]